jgi:thymidylate synthase
MKRVVSGWTVILFACSLCVLPAAQSQSGSLSDLGRDLGKNDLADKRAARSVYDNDNLPTADTINVVGSAPDGTSGTKSGADVAERASDAKPSPEQKKKDAGEIKISQSPKERQKAYAQWENRIDKRKDKVDQLARELESLKQNPPMSVVVLHLWPDDKLYFQLIAEKQKALDQATAELGDLQEQARRAGVPSSFTEGVSRIATPQSANDRNKTYADGVSLLQARKSGAPSSQTDTNESKDATEKASDSNSQATDNSQAEQKDAAEIKIGQSPQERQKAYAEWKKRIGKRDEKIEQLTRELDDLKQNIPTAVIFHIWPEDQIYLQLVAEKQKALDQAKADRSDFEEDARHAGVPSSFR